MSTFEPRRHFLHKELTPIEGRPTQLTLTAAYRQLRTNLRRVPSPFGGGHRGHLRLLYTLPDYNALPAMAGQPPFVDPAHPGPQAIIPPGATTAAIHRITQDYDTRLHQWEVQDATDKAAVEQLMKAIDPTYYRVL